MTIESFQLAQSSVNGAYEEVVYEFTDHLGQKHFYGKRVLIGSDHFELMQAMVPDVEQKLADDEVKIAIADLQREVAPKALADHQPQADYYRRVLGRAMQFADVHQFYAAYSFFQAMESDGGANATARAAYLGVDTTTYNEMATRFGNVNGVAWFLTDEKDQIWDDLPIGWY